MFISHPGMKSRGWLMTDLVGNQDMRLMSMHHGWDETGGTVSAIAGLFLSLISICPCQPFGSVA